MSMGRRFTAREMLRAADDMDVLYEEVQSAMLRQAAETEAQVMGLIEAASRLVVKPDGRSCFESGADTERFREALSKFRGEDNG